jgi:hypothetical protein
MQAKRVICQDTECWSRRYGLVPFIHWQVKHIPGKKTGCCVLGWMAMTRRRSLSAQRIFLLSGDETWMRSLYKLRGGGEATSALQGTFLLKLLWHRYVVKALHTHLVGHTGGTSEHFRVGIRIMFIWSGEGDQRVQSLRVPLPETAGVTRRFSYQHFVTKK